MYNYIQMKKYIKLFKVLLIAIGIIGLSSYASAATKNMLIVLDASGSMTDMFGTVSRIDAAKTSISDLLSGLDNSIQVGFRPYAHIKKDVKADACKVTELITPFTNDYSTINDAVSKIDAVGSYTPTAYTLQQLKSDFTAGNDNVVILLTDGKETCGGNPAQAAAALLAAGIKVKTYVIGLGLNAESKTQLTSVANAGGGKYFDATNAATLSSSFKAIQDEEKAIDKTNNDSLLGSSVTGGNGFDTAVPITPGMYHLSHYQLPSRYDYFKMNVSAGDIVSISLRGAESGVRYIPSTNSFKVIGDHYGDYGGLSVYSSLRTKIDDIYSFGASQMVKGDIVIDAETAGTIYFLVGNVAREDSYDSVMDKSDLFSIKVTSPAKSNRPESQITTGNGTDNSSSNTNSNTSQNDNSSIDNSLNSTNGSTDSPDFMKGLRGTFGTIMKIIIGAVILVVIVIIIVVYLIVKNSKKKNSVTPMNPTMNNGARPNTYAPASTPAARPSQMAQAPINQTNPVAPVAVSPQPSATSAQTSNPAPIQIPPKS